MNKLIILLCVLFSSNVFAFNEARCVNKPNLKNTDHYRCCSYVGRSAWINFKMARDTCWTPLDNSDKCNTKSKIYRSTPQYITPLKDCLNKGYNGGVLLYDRPK